MKIHFNSNLRLSMIEKLVRKFTLVFKCISTSKYIPERKRNKKSLFSVSWSTINKRWRMKLYKFGHSDLAPRYSKPEVVYFANSIRFRSRFLLFLRHQQNLDYWMSPSESTIEHKKWQGMYKKWFIKIFHAIYVPVTPSIVP